MSASGSWGNGHPSTEAGSPHAPLLWGPLALPVSCRAILGAYIRSSGCAEYWGQGVEHGDQVRAAFQQGHTAQPEQRWALILGKCCHISESRVLPL